MLVGFYLWFSCVADDDVVDGLDVVDSVLVGKKKVWFLVLVVESGRMEV